MAEILGVPTNEIDFQIRIFERNVNTAPTYNDLVDALKAVDTVIDRIEADIALNDGKSLIDANITITAALDRNFEVDASAGGLTIMFDDPANLVGLTFNFWRKDTVEANLVEFNETTGVALISYEAFPVDDIIEMQGENVTIYCDGVNFFIK